MVKAIVTSIDEDELNKAAIPLDKSGKDRGRIAMMGSQWRRNVLHEGDPQDNDSDSS